MKMNNYLLRLTALIAILALAGGLPGCGKNPDVITGAELAMRVESGNPPVILDVRPAEEYDEGHIPGAINISHLELEARLTELDAYRNDEIVVHCVSGKRAALARNILIKAGFADVRDLEGHMQRWQENAYPLE